MDGPRDYHTKWSKTERKREISYDIVYMRNLKKRCLQMSLFTKQRLTDVENRLKVTKGERCGGERLGVRDWHVHTAIFKIDNQQGPTV